MAIYATPLLTAPPLPQVENGVEILICEARLGHCATNDPTDYKEWQLMTVLVLIDPSPSQRFAARSLAASYVAAHSSFHQLPALARLDDWIKILLHGRVAASLCLVISLPPVYSDETSRQIETVLAKLRTRNHHHLQLAIAVGLQPADWMACDGVNGFVTACADHAHQDALGVFNMLAAFMAPGLSCAFDSDDLLILFSDPTTQSRVTSGVWLPKEKTFFSATAEDLKKIKNCRAVAFMPSISLPISSQSELTKAIRQLATKAPNLVVIAPYGLTSEPTYVRHIVPVLLLTVSANGSAVICGAVCGIE